jgi:hypothetical protein
MRRHRHDRTLRVEDGDVRVQGVQQVERERRERVFLHAFAGSPFIRPF